MSSGVQKNAGTTARQTTFPRVGLEQRMDNQELITLYRPVNQKELDLIRDSGWKKFPPRLMEQPIFYPVTNLEYARQISTQWNVPAYGIGHVTKFNVKSDYLKKFKVKNVGGRIHNELWVPAEELEEFNNNIVGLIEVLETHAGQ